MKCCIHRALYRVHVNPFRTSQRTVYVPYKDQWLITLCKTRAVYYRDLTELTDSLRALQKTLLALLHSFIIFLFTGAQESKIILIGITSTVTLILYYRQIQGYSK